MLTPAQEMLDALRRTSVSIFFDVNVGTPVSKTYRERVESIPSLRQDVRALRRTPDVGSLSVVLSDDQGKLNPLRGGGHFYAKAWHGAIVTVDMGVEVEDGRDAITPETIFKGVLDDVVLNEFSGTAELVCIDPLARLRRDDVDATTEGLTYSNLTPAAIVRDLLAKSGFTSLIDETQFAANTQEESAADIRIVDYTVQAGTWWSNIERLLEHNNAGLRMSSGGLFIYDRFKPQAAADTFTLDTAKNVTALTVRSPGGHVFNQVVVQRRDTAAAEGNYVETASSPLEDATSQTEYQTRRKDLFLEFDNDAVAESVGGELLEYAKDAAAVIGVTATLDTFVLELGDVANVNHTESGRGWSADGLVTSRVLNAAGGTMQFVLVNSTLVTGPWLFCDKSHTLGSGKKIW